jgi:hypothetical protein
VFQSWNSEPWGAHKNNIQSHPPPVIVALKIFNNNNILLWLKAGKTIKKEV